MRKEQEYGRRGFITDAYTLEWVSAGLIRFHPEQLNRKDLDKIISDAQDKAKGDRGEEEKVPLKEQLKNLDEEMKENVNRINSENSKKKSKSKNKDDKGAR